MNRQAIAGIALVILLIAGAFAIGIGAYNAGVTAGLVQGGQIVVAPGQAVGPYVGGYAGHGWFGGLFGFLGFLLFLFLLFALLRAAFGGWGRGRGGWGGRSWGPEGRHGPWDERMREFHDELHRRESADAGAAQQTGSTPGDQSR
ncbi:MAG TPA: hypothetical protein VH723_07050 [Candidatus Limnocylindrales bacterium]|jgi:hypothetical protein